MSGYLIIRLKGLGDIVHLIPSLKMIREKNPTMKLGLLCQKPFGQIVPKSLNIRIFDLPSGAGFWDTLRFLKDIRREGYEKLFDLFGNPRTAVLSLLSGIPERYGFKYRIREKAYSQTYTPPDSNKHLLYLFNDFFNFFGIEGKIQNPKLVYDKTIVEKIENWFSKVGRPNFLLGINPHTTYPSKAWPKEHFIEFIKLWYNRTGQKVLVTWGPEEKSAAVDIVRQAGEEKAFIHESVNIPEFATVLSFLDLFLTADTGPMNIAWAVDTPTVALFGPTTRKSVAPRGNKHMVLFKEDLDCLQCHQEQCDHKSCMWQLEPEYVLNRIVKKYAIKIGKL